ncbi:type I restriction endonuclease [Spirochaetia bacterium]|nr:type I restriction endonuclease [Spirochaetia bacterium]
MLKAYKDYQDTTYDWLPKVPLHWNKKTLRSITKLSDKRLGENKQAELLSVYREYGVIQKKSRDDNHNVESENLANYKYVEKGDLVMNKMKMWQGSLGISEYNGIVSPAYIVCKLITDANLKYLQYLLRSPAFKTYYNRVSYGIRVGQWDMHYDDFKSLMLFLPSLSEQDQIVRFLDWKVSMINAYIKAKKKQIELLKEELQAYLFSENGMITELGYWNDCFPENWKMQKVRRLFKESTLKGYTEKELLAVTQERGVLYKKDCAENYVSPSGDYSTQKLVRPCDFIISLRSFQGGIELSLIEGLVSPAYTVIALIQPEQHLITYYRYLFKCKPFISYLNTLVADIRDGKKIGFKDFGQCFLPVPPKPHLDKIDKLSKRIDIINSNAGHFVKLLQEYRTCLISDVVTGKVDVRGVKVPEFEVVEEAVNEVEETKEQLDEITGDE